jgi:uncharacterized membrane protein
MVGTVHWICASLVLLAGGLQLAGPKGTRAHRRLGWAYAGLLLAVNATALVTYRETGSWNQFHTLAVISLATLLVALGGFAVVGARWWVAHAYFSGGSYLGVVLAGLFQLATHLPMRTEAVRGAWLIAALLGAWMFLWKGPRDVRGVRPIASSRPLIRACP